MKLTSMNNSTISRMYKQNVIYDPAITSKVGSIISVPHIGRYTAIQAKPIASVSAYQDWLDRSQQKRNSGGKYTAAKIRRAVIMRRQGSSFKECGEAVGADQSAVRSWLEFLPLELSV